jgi:hypothetical protein
MYDCFTVLLLEIRIRNPVICPWNFKFRRAPYTEKKGDTSSKKKE